VPRPHIEITKRIACRPVALGSDPAKRWIWPGPGLRKRRPIRFIPIGIDRLPALVDCGRDGAERIRQVIDAGRARDGLPYYFAVYRMKILRHNHWVIPLADVPGPGKLTDRNLVYPDLPLQLPARRYRANPSPCAMNL